MIRSSRVRITFSKSGALIYIGNLDLLAIWERATRRARLALAYTKGFHPQPKIHFAAPLPLGFSSRCEVLDMRIDQEVDPLQMAAQLQKVLPSGIQVLGIEIIPPDAPTLQTQVQSAEYEISLTNAIDSDDMTLRISNLLAAASLSRERRGKSYDLRPLVEFMRLEPGSTRYDQKIFVRLSAREGATGRPEEVLEVLGISQEDTHIERSALILRSQSPL